MYQQDIGIARSASGMSFINQPAVSIPLLTPFTSVSLAPMNTAFFMDIPMSAPTFTMIAPMSLAFSSFASEL